MPDRPFSSPNGENAFAKWRKIPTGWIGFERVRRGKGSALTESMKGEFEMTITDRIEQMPAVEKVFIASVGVAALMLAAMVAMTLLLVVFKIAIGGIC
jgi:hypothetical protein